MQSIDLVAMLQESGAQRLVEPILILDLELNQRRMAREERPGAGEDALLLAFRVDLDEVDLVPPAGTVLQSEAGDLNRLARPGAVQTVELARPTKRKIALASAVGHRCRDDLQIVGAIDATAALEHRSRRAARLVGEHVSMWTHGPRHGQAVDTDICPDIDCRHAGLEPAQQEVELLLEPLLLLQQHIRRHRIERGRHRQRNAALETEDELIHGMRSALSMTARRERFAGELQTANRLPMLG